MNYYVHRAIRSKTFLNVIWSVFIFSQKELYTLNLFTVCVHCVLISICSIPPTCQKWKTLIFMLFSSPFMGYPAYDLDLDFPIGHYVCHILVAKVRHFGDNKKSQLLTQRNARSSAQWKLARMTERISFLLTHYSCFNPMTPKIVHIDRPCLEIGSGKWVTKKLHLFACCKLIRGLFSSCNLIDLDC